MVRVQCELIYFVPTLPVRMALLPLTLVLTMCIGLISVALDASSASMFFLIAFSKS